MSRKRLYSVEKREEISKANTNNSTAKMLWSFGKSKRFITQKSECPYISYQHSSMLSKKKHLFPKSKRKVFLGISKTPSSWIYDPKILQKNNVFLSFGDARQKCISNSYIGLENMKNPGPGAYLKPEQNNKAGFSMRPKTAYQRLYFIENKQQKDVPCPSRYQITTDRNGISMNSKFKSTCLGPYGPQSKNERFKTSYQHYPAPNAYKPKKSAIVEYSRGGKIGVEQRKSFIDKIFHKSSGLGPGNYRVPTQFGNYEEIKIQSKHSVI